ncbi:M10 family metallopeptidase [Arenibacterium sp. CAU 1754]
MSGTGHSTFFVLPSGDPAIDGILHEKGWNDSTITYAFPTSNLEYGSYGANEDVRFFPVTALAQDTVHFALSETEGPAADAGFSVEGFTELDFEFVTDMLAHVRVAQTTLDPYGLDTAWSYYPSSGQTGGDVWLTTQAQDFSAPQAGNYANYTILHELGHSLGLKHAHEDGIYGALPAAYDAMEYTVMTYRSYVNAGTSSFSNETWGYAQTYMMLDIAAFQYLYGADFSSNSGDTVYSWSPDTGETFIDGVAAITPGDNRIFATIWDGDGEDTYDLSAYSNGVTVDLKPGQFSLFSDLQQASLGNGQMASGNIYNALLYEDDYRSMIENAVGGTGGDLLKGNAVGNMLDGLSGDDDLHGRQGNDHLYGRKGNDDLRGGAGSDMLFGGSEDDTLDGGKNDDELFGGRGSDVMSGGTGSDNMAGGLGDDTLNGGDDDDILTGGDGEDDLSGGSGNDWIRGGRMNDLLNGGSGSDILSGGDGHDILHGGEDRDVLNGKEGQDTLYGDEGDDVLNGGDGDDILTGGLGFDRLIGGDDCDVFRFESSNDSLANGRADQIRDFQAGMDLIDLAGLSTTEFTVGIENGFAGSGCSGYTQETSEDTLIFVDVDGDGNADFEVEVIGVTGLSLDDFLL